jgi:hypothetical protein
MIMKRINTQCLIFFCLMLIPTVGLTQKANRHQLYFSIETFDYNYYNQLVNRTEVSYDSSLVFLKTKNGLWKITTRIDSAFNYKDYHVCFNLVEGSENSANVGIRILMNEWSSENYVLMPAVAYNGNRFVSRSIAYSPKLLDSRDIGKDKGMIISDVPRLNIGDGLSRIQERSGAMAVPSFFYYSVNLSEAFGLMSEQQNEWGDYGYCFNESRDRREAVLSLRSPVVREYYRYKIASNVEASPDIPANYKKGDMVNLHFRTYCFKADGMQSVFDKYIKIRQALLKPTFAPIYPFSKCFSVLEQKFNNQNFVEQWGYYSVGMRNMFLQDWQIGWTGGMITTYPLLFSENSQTVSNVIRNFDWVFKDGIAPSGFFWDSGERGNKWYGGDIRKPQSKNWHLIRKSGDALYYIIKQFMLMERKNIEVKKLWKDKTIGVADAFVRLWNKEKQFGQFVDSNTGEIVVGGSTSAAIVPAALVLASSYFNKPEYLQVAEVSANQMYEQYIRKGITCGGPGDALQNCDSESGYAMLESFALLYDYTRNEKWKKAACDMASQFSTWVAAYSYDFPKGCLFDSLKIKSTGAVFANTQNKHGSPGICTHSGIALLRLYRSTNDSLYLHLLKEIAYNMPQYMSYITRPIAGMDPGWVNERVNTTDWLEGIGEIFNGSTWAETALMLTTVELPGIYVDLSNHLAISFDDLEVKYLSTNRKNVRIEVHNPTKFGANFSVLIDSEKSKIKPLGENRLYDFPKYTIAAGEKKIFMIPLFSK